MPAFLQLMGVDDGFARAVRRLAPLSAMPVFELSARYSGAGCLARRSTLRRVSGWLSGGLVRFLWICMDNSTFGPGAAGADIFRDPLGRAVANLAPWDALRVRDADKLARAVMVIVLRCVATGVPAVIECPSSSRLWRLPAWAAARPLVRTVVCDWCGFGAAIRRPTTLLVHGVCTSPLERRCGGGKTWFFSGVSHHYGPRPGTCGPSRYPDVFSRCAADAIAHTLLGRTYEQLAALSGQCDNIGGEVSDWLSGNDGVFY
jgi:hypothetical protein